MALRLANLSRAFQRKEVDFTVVKPPFQGKKGDALLMTPREYFQSLPTILPELRQFGVGQPSDYEIEDFKRNEYKRYLVVPPCHIAGRYPDVALFEGFGIFDPVGLPQDIATHATHGADMLHILIDHYGQHGVINTKEC